MRRVALVTDFGAAGPYLGQMRCSLNALAPSLAVIDLVSDLTPFRPDLAAYLLPAIARDIPPETLYLCVVDPGVGGDRAVLAVDTGDSLFLGPDNGLLSQVAQRHARRRIRRLGWRPDWMSDSFHGRDLFVPLAIRLLQGEDVAAEVMESAAMVGSDWPADVGRVLYVDRYGNLVTGLRAAGVNQGARLRVGGKELEYARTFCSVAPGTAFWYENSFGLLEVAVCQSRADLVLGLGAGDLVELFA